MVAGQITGSKASFGKYGLAIGNISSFLKKP
jgi:hypothetical protein